VSKRLEEKVQVITNARGHPLRLRRGRRQVRVRQLVDEWEEASRWWQGEQEMRVYRVLTSDGAMWELHRRASCDWRLYRIYD